jgi:hypothetical protein
MNTMTLDELLEKLLELRKHEEGYTPVIFAHGAFETRWPAGLPIPMLPQNRRL